MGRFRLPPRLGDVDLVPVDCDAEGAIEVFVGLLLLVPHAAKAPPRPVTAAISKKRRLVLWRLQYRSQ